MKRTLKYIRRSVIALLLIISVLAVTLVALPSGGYQSIIVKLADMNGLVADFKSPLVIDKNFSATTIAVENLHIYKPAIESAIDTDASAKIAQEKIDIRIENASLNINVRALFSGKLHINHLISNNINVDIASFKKPQEEDKAPKQVNIATQIKSLVNTIQNRLAINKVQVNNTRLLLTQFPTPNNVSAEELTATSAEASLPTAQPEAEEVTNVSDSIESTEASTIEVTDSLPVVAEDAAQNAVTDIVITSLQCPVDLCAKQMLANGQVNGIDFNINLAQQNSPEPALNNNTYLLTADIGNAQATALTTITNTGNVLAINSALKANLPLINYWISNDNLPNMGPVDFSADFIANLPDKDPSVTLDNIALNIKDKQLTAALTGAVKDIGNSNQIEMTAKADINDIGPLASLLLPSATFAGDATLDMQVKGFGSDIDINIDTLNANIEDTKLQINGSLENIIHSFTNPEVITASNKNTLSINLQAKSLNVVNKLMPKAVTPGQFVPRMPASWGPINGSAVFSQTAEGININDIDIAMEGKTNANINGSLDLNDLSKSVISLKATLATLEEINAFTSAGLPDIGPINATANLVLPEQSKSPSLTNIIADYNGQYGVVDLQGIIGNLFAFKDVNLDYSITAKSLKVAELFAPIELPDIGPLTASGALVTKPRPGKPELLEIDLLKQKVDINSNGIKASVNGEITNLISQKAFLNLNANVDTQNIDFLAAYIENNLPQSAKITGKANLSGNVTNGFEVSLDNIKMSGEHYSATVNGKFSPENPTKSKQGIDFVATTDSLKAALSEFNINNESVTIDGKLDASFNLKAIQDGYSLSNAKISLDDNLIAANLDFINEEGKKYPGIYGHLLVENLDITEFIPVPKEQKVKPKKREKTRFFTDAPFFTTYFNDINANIKFDVANLTTPHFDFTKAYTTIVSKDGILDINLLNGQIADGTVDIEIKSNSSIKPAITSLYINVKDADAKQITFMRNNDTVGEDGKVSLLLDVSGDGSTMKNFMAGLDGEVILNFRDLDVKSTALDLIGSDVIVNLFDSINPLSQKSDRLFFNCAVVNYKVNEGIATSKTGIAAESKAFVILGDSKVNLKNEKLNLAITTKANEGLGLSISSLANIVQIGGHIYDPKVTVSATGLAKTGLSLGAAFFTAGTSLLIEGIYDRYTASGDLCSEALHSNTSVLTGENTSTISNTSTDQINQKNNASGLDTSNER